MCEIFEVVKGVCVMGEKPTTYFKQSNRRDVRPRTLRFGKPEKPLEILFKIISYTFYSTQKV